MQDKEATEVGKSNADMALDQIGAYPNALDAIDAYAHNVVDTMRELGCAQNSWSTRVALGAYFQEIARRV
jgi:hypothetical protein